MAYAEVRGCIEVMIDGQPCVEEAPMEFADFYGLYVQDDRGLMIWHSDYPTEEKALKAKEEFV